MSGLLVAGYVERHTGQKLLKVIAEGEQLPLTARVVGEVPDIPAPKWWARARREQQSTRFERRWWPPSQRGDAQALGVTILPFGSGWPVNEARWRLWDESV